MPKLNLKMLERYLMTFVNDQKAETRYVEQYSAFYDSVFNLSAILEDHANPSGKKTLQADDISNLRKAYEDVLIKADYFKAAAGESDLREQPELAGRIACIDSFCKYVSEDMVSLSNIADAKGKTIDDIFDDARSYTIDISDQSINNAGANMSSRIPISFEDKSGKTLTGFFTPETRVSRDEETIRMFSKAKKDHPEYDLALRVIVQDYRFKSFAQDLLGAELKVKTYLQDDDILKVYKDIAKDVLEHNTNQRGNFSEDEYKEYLALLSTDKEFSMRLLNMLNEFAQILNRDDIYQYVGIDNGSIVEQRNAAMSVIGDLIGTPDLLARSVQMSILDNGVRTKGVFMEFAGGSDILHMKEDDPLKKVTYEQMDNPGLLKQLADLQVLDYICGNTDRHPGNMFYQFKETENGQILSGIIGIDNDNSFGKTKMYETQGLMQLPGVNSMLVINADTAAKIKGLSFPMISVALKNYSLSKDELDAVWKRVTDLQAKILEGEQYYRENPNAKPEPPHIKTVSNEEWNTLKLKDLSTYAAHGNQPERDYKNYFAQISKLPEDVADRIVTDIKEKEIRANIEAKHPELKKTGDAGFKMAKGVVLLETNKIGIEDNNRRLTSLEATMNSVNKGLFVSSKAFDAVIAAFDIVRKLSSGMNEGVSNDYLEKLNKAYRNLNGKLTTYLKKKEGEKNQKIKDGKTTSAVFDSRVDFANELQGFVNERIDGIENELARTKTAESLDSESMSAKYSQYVKNRIERQNERMLDEISALSPNDPYCTIKAKALNSRNLLRDVLIDANVAGNKAYSVKEAIADILILQVVDNYRKLNENGSKIEKAISNADPNQYRQLKNAITELPSVKKVLENTNMRLIDTQGINKQLIKELLLDNKAKHIVAGIPNAERKQFNSKAKVILNPDSKVRKPEAKTAVH